MIQKNGLKPSYITYSVLLHHFGQKGDLMKALEIFRLMKENKLQANIVTISSLINALSRHGK